MQYDAIQHDEKDLYYHIMLISRTFTKSALKWIQSNVCLTGYNAIQQENPNATVKITNTDTQQTMHHDF